MPVGGGNGRMAAAAPGSARAGVWGAETVSPTSPESCGGTRFWGVKLVKKFEFGYCIIFRYYFIINI